MRHPIAYFPLATLLAFSVTLPAQAGEVQLEVSTGISYSESDGFLDNEAAVGFRGGYRFNDRWAVQGSFSRVDAFDYGLPFVDFDGSATFFDASAMYFVNPRGKAEFFIYGGVGQASFDRDTIRIRLQGPFTDGNIRVNGRDEDGFTTHLGVGLNVRLTKLLYLRPDVRVRWLTGFDNDTVDTEPSLALGWRW